jgi:hypothetical protein
LQVAQIARAHPAYNRVRDAVLQGGRKKDRLASCNMDHEAKTELMSIVDGLSPEGRASIANLREDQVMRLHFGLGMYIRNQIRQGRLPALFRWSQTQVPGHMRHFDDVTFPILVEVWKLVNTPPPVAEKNYRPDPDGALS